MAEMLRVLSVGTLKGERQRKGSSSWCYSSKCMQAGLE